MKQWMHSVFLVSFLALLIGINPMCVSDARADLDLSFSPPPAMNEVFWIDSYSTSMDMGVVETSATVLKEGIEYTVTVEGTFSFWAPEQWNYGYSGTPEPEPIYPSPDTINGQVGVDSEFTFAIPNGRSLVGESRQNTEAMPWLLFSVTGDTFETFFDPVPVESGMTPGHLYTYKVVGAGLPLHVLIMDDFDRKLPNNYGRLRVEILSPKVVSDLEVPVDIKPYRCPNYLNMKRKFGVLHVSILGTETFNVEHIAPKSIRLLDVEPLWCSFMRRHSMRDVGTPFEPYVGKEFPDDCNTDGPDGIVDLNLMFVKKKVIKAIEKGLDCGPRIGDVIVLPLTGNLKEEFGGTPFVGEDVVVIINQKYKKKK